LAAYAPLHVDEEMISLAKHVAIKKLLINGKEWSVDAVALIIYNYYPRKVGRTKALASIIKCLMEGEDPVLMRNATRKYAECVASWPEEEKRYIPHPSTWFNQGRFMDDPENWLR